MPAARKPRIKVDPSPVEVVYRPEVVSRRRAAERTDLIFGQVEALPAHRIPEHLRAINPVVATAGYQLADGKWGRVRPDPKDPRAVIVV